MDINNQKNLFGYSNLIEENEFTNQLYFRKTIIFFYNCCIERVNISRKEMGLKKYQVCASQDKSITSNFFKGKCTKNNPYLITQKLIGYKRGKQGLKDNEAKEDKWAEDESGKKIGIIHTLNFENEKEVLWGTDNEIKRNLQMIYLLIMQELPIYCFEYIKDWEEVLFDYVPYSKYKTLLEIKNKFNISLYETYGVKDEEVSEIKLSIYQLNAISYFFYNESFRNEFLEMFLSFANEQKNFTHIDKKFKENFIVKRFIPLLKKYKPKHETSLGLRVRDLLVNDLQCLPELFLSVKNKKTDDDLKRMLNKASSRYITELEIIQNNQIGYLFK